MELGKAAAHATYQAQPDQELDEDQHGHEA
jgi:hypothetical protein